MGVGIAYVDGARLRRSLLAAADWVAAGRDELNRLNVFPVPDGDTGTNLCLTLRAVARALRAMGEAPAPTLPRVTATMAQASVRGARGNSGLMLSQFLLGLQEGLGERLTASARELAHAIRRGFDRLHASLDEPVEGTILTVARDAADEASSAAGERDLREFMRRIVRRAETSLSRTPELLATLKAAGVVDAGAKGFVRFLDGVKRLIDEGQTAEGAVDRLVAADDAAARTEVIAERDYRYCTEILVRGERLPAGADVRRELRGLGGSIVVLRTADLLKAHVHTDTPDRVFALAAAWGALETTKAEDMRAQHRALAVRRPLAVVTDTGCDLPDAQVFENGIGLVPLQLVVGDRVYRDRFELTAAEFLRRLRRDAPASTSQPAPQDFVEAFRDALRGAERVLVVTLSGALSGTKANAEAAARQVNAEAGADRVVVVDSRSASLGQGLLALRAHELAGAAPAEAIARELTRVRDRSGMFFTVDSLDRLVRSGRVSRFRGWLGTRLNLKPIMTLSRDGAVAPLARERGRPAVRRRILALLEEALRPAPRELRLGVVHCGIPEFAEALRAELVERYRPKQCLISSITPVIATHAGIGAWGVFYQIEDGPAPPAGREQTDGNSPI